MSGGACVIDFKVTSETMDQFHFWLKKCSWIG